MYDVNLRNILDCHVTDKISKLVTLIIWNTAQHNKLDKLDLEKC